MVVACAYVSCQLSSRNLKTSSLVLSTVLTNIKDPRHWMKWLFRHGAGGLAVQESHSWLVVAVESFRTFYDSGCMLVFRFHLRLCRLKGMTGQMTGLDGDKWRASYKCATSGAKNCTIYRVQSWLQSSFFMHTYLCIWLRNRSLGNRMIQEPSIMLYSSGFKFKWACRKGIRSFHVQRFNNKTKCGGRNIVWKLSENDTTFG